MLTLNLGCGINRKRLYDKEFEGVVFHIDKNPDIGADIVWDLNRGLPWSSSPDARFAQDSGVPFDNNVDEVHAYHLIEHIGEMGKTEVWFGFWRDCWRALRSGGLMFIVAPYYLHENAIGDPTHTRLICRQTFHFLDRSSYLVKPGGVSSAISQLDIDFDFVTKEIKTQSEGENTIPHTIMAVLEARKTPEGGLVNTKQEAAK